MAVSFRIRPNNLRLYLVGHDLILIIHSPFVRRILLARDRLVKALLGDIGRDRQARIERLVLLPQRAVELATVRRRQHGVARDRKERAYLPRAEALVATPAGVQAPVLFCHGDADPVVPILWARMSSDRVKTLGGHDVVFKAYRGMAHSASEAELRDAGEFLERLLPSTVLRA